MGNDSKGAMLLVLGGCGSLFLIAIIGAGVFVYFKYFNTEDNPNKLQGACIDSNISQATLSPSVKSCTYKRRDKVSSSPDVYKCAVGAWDTTADWTDCVKNEINEKQCTSNKFCAQLVRDYYKMIEVVPGTTIDKPNPRQAHPFGLVK